MICANCGREIADGSAFCRFCGTKVGNNDALKFYELGYNYYYAANGYTQDYAQAYQYFCKSANLGNIEAMNYLGLMFWDGLGVPANIQTTIGCFQQALKVNPNFGRAHYNLGRIFYTGAAGKKDYDLAYQHFIKAIEFGKGEGFYGYACHFVGYILMEIKKQPHTSVQYFVDAVTAEPSIAEAWYNLGTLRYKGYFESKYSPNVYYEKAADLGLSAAYYELGMWYMQRYMDSGGDPQIQKLAFYWFDKGVEAGDKRAKRWRTMFWAWKDDFIRIREELRRNGGVRTSSSSASSETSSNNVPAQKGSIFAWDGYYDGSGAYRRWGDDFCDGSGAYRRCGDDFVDSKGNYCRWGSNFYDSKGCYRNWGDDFYDGKGEYVRWGSKY